MALPLSGIRVLELAPLLPGSLCTQMLADLGADVIKIESPNGGDNFRWTPPVVKTLGSYFHVLNRNKRAMTLDLKKPEGRWVFRRLAERSDVLIENLRPGMMKAMGLGYQDLKEINGRLVYCSLTGFGQDGPYSNIPAHDINFLAISGILDLMSEKGGTPVTPAIQIAGAGGGSLQAAIGILSALLRRERTGSGEYMDVALLDGLTPFLSLVMSEYMAGGPLPRGGTTFVGGGYAFYNVYETKDGRHITIGCVEQKYWESFCRAIGREDLAEEQLSPPPRQDAVIAEIRAVIRGKTREEWISIFSRHEACFAPVNTLEEALQDPQIRHRALWFKGRHPVDGDIPQQAFPVKFSDDQPGWKSHPPVLGEHTIEVLQEMGLSDGEIGELKKLNVI